MQDAPIIKKPKTFDVGFRSALTLAPARGPRETEPQLLVWAHGPQRVQKATRFWISAPPGAVVQRVRLGYQDIVENAPAEFFEKPGDPGALEALRNNPDLAPYWVNDDPTPGVLGVPVAWPTTLPGTMIRIELDVSRCEREKPLLFLGVIRFLWADSNASLIRDPFEA